MDPNLTFTVIIGVSLLMGMFIQFVGTRFSSPRHKEVCVKAGMCVMFVGITLAFIVYPTKDSLLIKIGGIIFFGYKSIDWFLRTWRWGSGRELVQNYNLDD